MVNHSQSPLGISSNLTVALRNPDFLLYSIIDFGTITVGQVQIDRNFTVFQLIWIIETLTTFVLVLYLLRYIKKRNLINEWYKEYSSV